MASLYVHLILRLVAVAQVHLADVEWRQPNVFFLARLDLLLWPEQFLVRLSLLRVERKGHLRMFPVQYLDQIDEPDSPIVAVQVSLSLGTVGSPVRVGLHPEAVPPSGNVPHALQVLRHTADVRRVFCLILEPALDALKHLAVGEDVAEGAGNGDARITLHRSLEYRDSWRVLLGYDFERLVRGVVQQVLGLELD